MGYLVFGKGVGDGGHVGAYCAQGRLPYLEKLLCRCNGIARTLHLCGQLEWWSLS